MKYILRAWGQLHGGFRCWGRVKYVLRAWVQLPMGFEVLALAEMCLVGMRAGEKGI